MSILTESDLADLAERYGDIPWAVYLQGLDRVETHEIPDVPEDAPGNAPLQRESAIALAEQIDDDAITLNALHGVSVGAQIMPFVLHHGIVWNPR